MDITKRKPDLETESLRIWKARGKEKEESLRAEGTFEIAYKDLTLTLIGFRQVRRGANDEVVFAWKFKEDEKVVLYYLRDKQSKAWNEFLAKLKSTAEGYEFQDVENVLKDLYEQKHVLGKL